MVELRQHSELQSAILLYIICLSYLVEAWFLFIAEYEIRVSDDVSKERQSFCVLNIFSLKTFDVGYQHGHAHIASTAVNDNWFI